MGYKQSPFPMAKGTSGHKSALKIVASIIGEAAVDLVKDMTKNGDEGGGEEEIKKEYNLDIPGSFKNNKK